MFLFSNYPNQVFVLQLQSSGFLLCLHIFFSQSSLKVGDPRKGETEVMELFSLSLDKLPPDTFLFCLPLLAGAFDIGALWYASQSEQLLSLCSWKLKTSGGITMSFSNADDTRPLHFPHILLGCTNSSFSTSVLYCFRKTHSTSSLVFDFHQSFLNFSLLVTVSPGAILHKFFKSAEVFPCGFSKSFRLLLEHQCFLHINIKLIFNGNVDFKFKIQ